MGGKGNPYSGKCSTQTQTAGARKRQPGKICVHPKVNSVLFTSPSSLHSGPGFPPPPLVYVSAKERTRTREGASGVHGHGRTRDFVGASLMPVCICLEHHTIDAVSFEYMSTMMAEKGLIWGTQDPTNHLSRIYPLNLPVQCSHGP